MSMYEARQNKEKVSRVIQWARNTKQFNAHISKNVETKRNYKSSVSNDTIQRQVLLTKLLEKLELTTGSRKLNEFYHGGHCYFPRRTYSILRNKFQNDCKERPSSHYSFVNKRNLPDTQIMVTTNIDNIDSMKKNRDYPFLFGFLPNEKITWGQMEGAPYSSIKDLIPHTWTTLRHYKFGLAPFLGYVNIGPEGYTSNYSEKNKLVLESIPATKKRLGRLKDRPI